MSNQDCLIIKILPWESERVTMFRVPNTSPPNGNESPISSPSYQMDDLSLPDVLFLRDSFTCTLDKEPDEHRALLKVDSICNRVY